MMRDKNRYKNVKLDKITREDNIGFGIILVYWTLFFFKFLYYLVSSAPKIIMKSELVGWTYFRSYIVPTFSFDVFTYYT